MRVLIAALNLGIAGGVETYLRELLPLLRARGHDLALMHEHNGGAAGRVDDLAGDLPRWSLEDGAAGVLRAAAAWRPDVCYLQGLASPAAEAELARLFPTVLFAHNYHGTCISGTKHRAWPSPRPCARPLGAGCLLAYFPCRCGGLDPRTFVRLYRAQRRRRALLGRFRAVAVASRHMREEYRRNGVPEDRLWLLPLFPAGAEPDPDPHAGRPGQGSVLMVGRLTDLKGGRLLVEAVSRAGAALGRALSLRVAGDGPDRPAMQEAARRAGVRAEFCGWVERDGLTRLMREADVLAVPSVWPEPFGLVGIEAGCVGLPAVAYAVGGIRDWLRPGESGELAPADPPTAAGLAGALVRALADPRHLSRLAHGAWQVAREFTPERHLLALETLLLQTAGGDRLLRTPG
jgi:glycosyltransferase involved in cell wall biosynthesis